MDHNNFDPPFLKTYEVLLQKKTPLDDDDEFCVVETCELPVIDFSHLNDDDRKEKCIKQIIEAARNLGFFQIVNHGIPQHLLHSLICDQIAKVFHRPFAEKLLLSSQDNNNNHMRMMSCYKWGNQSATTLKQLSWSESYHVFLPDIPFMDQHTSLSLECFASRVAWLSERLAEILGNEVRMKCKYFKEKCVEKSCFIRMNRYPPCPINPSKVFGLIPHTDSTFLTILYQDQVGGLQVFQDNGIWVSVKPNPQALIVNIGDLFQAASNGVYKSVKHRVVVGENVERFSVAYFYCPLDEAVIESHGSPPFAYRKFTFREYKLQNHKDVKESGDKVGLSRFLNL